MSLTLIKHEIARSREGPVTGTKGPIIQYRVGGLPPEERAFIANFGGSSYEESWRVFHTKKGVDGRWNGDYKTADDALAALQIEYWRRCSAVLRGLAFRVATRWSQSRSDAGTWATQAM
jgi:hypothetical protein